MLATLPLVVGCPTEVPYQTDQEAPEAPASDRDEPDAETSDPAESVTEQPGEPTALTAPPEETSPAPAGDRYATPPGEAPARMPWEADQPDTEAPPEAERLFADAAAPVESSPEPETQAEEPSDGNEGFADFLDDAYAGMLDEEPPKEDAKAEPEAQPETAAAPAPGLGSRYNAEDLFAETQPAIDLPPSKPADTPKPPTTVEPSKSDLLNELWGDETDAAEPEPNPTPVAEPEPTKPEPAESITPGDKLPFGWDEQPLPPEPAPTPTERVEEPSLFTEQPEPRPAEPIDTLPDPPETGLNATTPEPTPSAPPEPAFDPPKPRGAPMASSAIDPLPAVPVLPFNTRHLAWLLGAKYGLAELADLDGATPDEVAEWSSEVERLAQELRIDVPASSRSATDPAQRVGRMMRSAARTGEALASEHGVDHAALLEISLKTNALLVVAEKRPDLAGPVARAVRDAADRALLPRFLWDQSVRVLESEPTPEEAHDAVTRLHERVESFLR